LFPVWKKKKNNSGTNRQRNAEHSFGARFIGGFEDKNLLVDFYLPSAVFLAGRFEHPSPIFIPNHICSEAK
jgi:hypothetical protein